MKTKRGIKTVISNWAKKTSKEWKADCLFCFEEPEINDKKSFYFKVDGFIYDAVNAVNGCDSFSFSEIFECTGWNYEFDSASVLLIFKEDF